MDAEEDTTGICEVQYEQQKDRRRDFLSPGDVDYHLRMIEIKTGLNPRVFVDLVKLLFLCGEGNMFGLGELL